MKKLERIWILGPSGSGKSYLANSLSKKLKLKSHDLDDIYWAKKWNVARSSMERQKILKKLARKKRWIIEGVFSSWIEEGIKKADLVIWLDFHITKLVWRLLLRHLKRGEDNLPQKWKDLFSMVNYTISYKEKNSRFLRYVKMINKHKLKVVIIKNNKQLAQLLQELYL